VHPRWDRRRNDPGAKFFSGKRGHAQKEKKAGNQKRDAHSGVHSSDERGEGAHLCLSLGVYFTSRRPFRAPQPGSHSATAMLSAINNKKGDISKELTMGTFLKSLDTV